MSKTATALSTERIASLIGKTTFTAPETRLRLAARKVVPLSVDLSVDYLFI